MIGGREVPEPIRGNDAQAYFGILDGELNARGGDPITSEDGASIALQIIEIIKSYLIVDSGQNHLFAADGRAH